MPRCLIETPDGFAKFSAEQPCTGSLVYAVGEQPAGILPPLSAEQAGYFIAGCLVIWIASDAMKKVLQFLNHSERSSDD